MVNVGIIGLGPKWESTYEPALKSLAGRMSVRAVFDAVSSRAAQVAGSINARAVDGVRPLARRDDIDSLLILDTNWHGENLFRLIGPSGKPTYFADALNRESGEICTMIDHIRSHEMIVMPEMSRRYTPTTSRLHELIVTQIGPPRNVTVYLYSPPSHLSGEDTGSDPTSACLLAEVFDWCHYVLRSTPLEITSLKSEPAGNNPPGDRQIQVRYGKPHQEESQIGVDFRIREWDPRMAKPVTEPNLVFEVHCQQGRAVLHSTTEIEWERNDTIRKENLAHERTNLEVILDHFCRRVVGGLIPVADMFDVHRCIQLVEIANQSLAEGQTVRVNG